MNQASTLHCSPLFAHPRPSVRPASSFVLAASESGRTLKGDNLPPAAIKLIPFVILSGVGGVGGSANLCQDGSNSQVFR